MRPTRGTNVAMVTIFIGNTNPGMEDIRVNDRHSTPSGPAFTCLHQTRWLFPIRRLLAVNKNLLSPPFH